MRVSSLPIRTPWNCRPFYSVATHAAVLILLAALPAAAQRVSRLPFRGPFRSIDGSGNNPANPTWGSANSDLLRRMPEAYGDSISTPAASERPNPRLVSNLVVAQPAVPPDPHMSNFLWIWGQFIDHDLDLTPTSAQAAPPFCGELMDIAIPAGDASFDPDALGGEVMHFCRSAFDGATGTTEQNPRQQINVITAFIDGSMIYGSDPVRAAFLRKNDGSGELKTSKGPNGLDLLPFNTVGLPNGDDNRSTLFIAGDKRANENSALTAMHVLFVREHNYWASTIHRQMPKLSEEKIFQLARAIVGAEIAGITYNEFLPILLGPNTIPTYRSWRQKVNPQVDTMFSTASYRFGHTMLSANLERLDSRLQPMSGGALSLRQAFFDPTFIEIDGIEPILRGAAHQHANAFDPFIVDDVRNFLINEPEIGFFDLASLNIQRGRDHGLGSYNDARAAFGLKRKPDIASINPKRPLITSRLQSAYKTVNDIDPWVGGLSEPPVHGAVVGELVRAVLADQFIRTRDGDRFFYKRIFNAEWIDYFDHLKLSDIIRRNTPIDREIQDEVFLIW